MGNWDYKKERSKVLKATVWYTLSNILLRGVSIFTAPLFTRMLSTSDYGIASNFNSWASILTCISGLSLSTAALRGKVEYKEKFKSFLSSIQLLGLFSTGICAIVLFFSLGFWSRLMELESELIVLMLVYVILSQSVGFAQIDYQFDYKYKQNVRISIFNAFTTVFFSVFFILALPEAKYIGRVLGLSLPCIIMGMYFSIKIFQNGKCGFNREYWEYALRLSLPMIPHGLATLVLGQVDRVMILKYCGESEAGIYSFGYSYAVLLAVVTNAVNDGVKPQMYDFLEKGEDKRLSSFMRKIIVGAVFITLVVVGVTPEVLKVLGTHEFYEARWIVFPVAIGTLMQFMYQNFSVIELYYKKTVYTAIGSVTAAFVNFILNMVLIPRHGFIAAAYTTMISYALLMIFHYIASCLAAKRKVYSFMTYVVASAAAITVGGLFNLIFDGVTFIRYGVLVLLVVCYALISRDDLRRLAVQVKRKAQ